MTPPSILKNEAFRKALMHEENGIRAGWDKKKSLWFPHKSPEGGMPTIAYGHKVLNVQEHEVFKKGLTEDQAIKLFDTDLKIAYDNVLDDWNRNVFTGPKFQDLPEKYQGVLVNIGYNTGSLMNRKGKYGWPNLSRRIVEATLDPTNKEKDKAVRLGMVTTYLDPKTKTRKKLTRRAYAIADSLGIA